MAGFGSMRNTLVFGLLASLGIVLAFIADVLVAPALLALVYRHQTRLAGFFQLLPSSRRLIP